VIPRAALAVLALAVLGRVAPAAAAETGWNGTYWGETSDALVKQFGSAVTRLDRPIDFGDAFVDVVVKNYNIGGFRFIVFFQMGKDGRGLKRIQIERGRHGAVPMVAKAAFDHLVAIYGRPDRSCATGARTVGEQNLVEAVWQQGQTRVRAIFREASLNALDPYLAREAGDSAFFGSASTGLSQQLLIRIAPAATEPDDCRKQPRRSR
jgi:hypothetical protein